jgi:hypothetical protein
MTWVQDGIFAAGGESLPEDWAAFAAQTGVTAILHLRPGSPAVFRGPSPASFLWMGLAGEADAALPERLAAGAFIEACRARGERVLLHASPGRHRTRWAFVAYRIWNGAAPASALRQAAEPPWLAPYKTDREAWDRMAEVVRGLSRIGSRIISTDRP